MELLEGSIIDTEAWARKTDRQIVVCHQVNCISKKGYRLSETMFNAFPFANVYKERSKKIDTKEALNRSRMKQTRIDGGFVQDAPLCYKPGDVVFRTKGNITVANIVGQHGRGPCKPWEEETPSRREGWFKACLDKVEDRYRDKDKISIGFPWGIACGAAGGEWDTYFKMIIAFAERVPNVRVVMVCNVL